MLPAHPYPLQLNTHSSVPTPLLPHSRSTLAPLPPQSRPTPPPQLPPRSRPTPAPPPHRVQSQHHSSLTTPPPFSLQAHCDELLAAVSTLVREFGAANNADVVNVDAFLQELRDLAATVTVGTPLQMLEKKVVLLWTSLIQLYVSDAHKPELCSIVNSILRDDVDSPALQAAIVFVVVLNKFTNAVRRSTDVKLFVDWPQLPWEPQLTTNTTDNQTWWARQSAVSGWVVPTGMLTFRGTAIPAAALDFFQVGKKYRTNMYLATSFRSKVVKTFMRRSLEANSGIDPSDSRFRRATLFIIKYAEQEDPPCNHVNYILPQDSAAPSPEYEFLFAPCSAFLVEQVHPHTPIPHHPRLLCLASCASPPHRVFHPFPCVRSRLTYDPTRPIATRTGLCS